MGWQPSPTDIKSTWRAWEFGLIADPSGMADGPELVLVFHQAGEGSWASVGASDGSVYMSSQSFELDVAAAGGFQNWLAPILTEINARLAAKCAMLDPAPPLQLAASLAGYPPATFADFQKWLRTNATWNGAAAPAPTPTPPPATGKPGNGWLQFSAGQQDLAIRVFVDADGVQRFALYRKDGPGAFTWIAPALNPPTV